MHHWHCCCRLCRQSGALQCKFIRINGNQGKGFAETFSCFTGSTVLQLVFWEGIKSVQSQQNPRDVSLGLAKRSAFPKSRIQTTTPAANAFLPPGLTLLMSSLAAMSNSSRSSRQRKQVVGHQKILKRPIATRMTTCQLTLFVFAILQCCVWKSVALCSLLVPKDCFPAWQRLEAVPVRIGHGAKIRRKTSTWTEPLARLVPDTAPASSCGSECRMMQDEAG